MNRRNLSGSQIISGGRLQVAQLVVHFPAGLPGFGGEFLRRPADPPASSLAFAAIGASRALPSPFISGLI